MGLLRGARLLPDGGVRVRIAGREHQVLQTLPAQLRQLLAKAELGAAGTAAVRDRLFPVAYDDPRFEEEYRELVGSQLADERIAALDRFELTLGGGRTSATWWTVDLSPGDADAWLAATNDARLILGALLGITVESQWEDDPSDDPRMALLHYLGWLQDQLVGAMTGALREEP